MRESNFSLIQNASGYFTLLIPENILHLTIITLGDAQIYQR